MDKNKVLDEIVKEILQDEELTKKWASRFNDVSYEDAKKELEESLNDDKKREDFYRSDVIAGLNSAYTDEAMSGKEPKILNSILNNKEALAELLYCESAVYNLSRFVPSESMRRLKLDEELVLDYMKSLNSPDTGEAFEILADDFGFLKDDNIFIEKEMKSYVLNNSEDMEAAAERMGFDDEDLSIAFPDDEDLDQDIEDAQEEFAKEKLLFQKEKRLFERAEKRQKLAEIRAEIDEVRAKRMEIKGLNTEEGTNTDEGPSV